MKNNSIIKKQYIKFIFLNLIVFTFIFSVFGIFIFNTVKSSIYSKSDEELFKTRDMLIGANKKPLEKTMPNSPNDLPLGIRNPNVTIIPRDENGKVMELSGVDSIYLDYFNSDITINDKMLDNVQNYQVSDANSTYDFRSLLVKATLKEDSTIYLQLLINVRGEEGILNNFIYIIIFAVIIAIILSLIASIFLSRHTLKPIISSWNKQIEFVENASHELRTPLTIIQNKLSQLLKTPNEKIIDKYEHIALPLSETRRLSKMVANLLTLARADSSISELEKTSFNLDSMIKDVVEPYTELASFENKTLKLELKSFDDINADKSRLHQLMVILLDNALKYTQSEDVITVSTYKRDTKFYMEVMDTGIGISDDGLKKVFDRFYREDKARSRKNGGSGLGLSIAKYIVEKHDGSINAMHNQPSGTIFKIKL